jgi:hypothetical protein
MSKLQSSAAFPSGELSSGTLQESMIEPGFQARLTPREFKERCEGYRQVPYPTFLQGLPLGTWIRYKIQRKGEHVQYRLGGALVYADPKGRFIKLKNFLIQPPNSWSVQLNSYHTLYFKLTPHGERVMAERKAAAAGAGCSITDQDVQEFLTNFRVVKLGGDL